MTEVLKDYHPLAAEIKASLPQNKPEVKVEQKEETKVVDPSKTVDTPKEIKEETPKASEEKKPEGEQKEQTNTEAKSTESVTEEIKEPEFDFGLKKEEEPNLLKKISGALNFDAKDEADLLLKISELKTKEQPLELPTELKEAVEAVKNGNNWRSVLGEIDYSKVDPVEAYEYEIEQEVRKSSKHFRKEDGSVDFDALDNYLDSIPMVEREMRGKEILASKQREQERSKQRRIAEAEQQDQIFKSKLAESSRNLNQLFPKDKFGIEWNPESSDYLYSGIASENLIKKHFGNVPKEILRGFDPNKVLKTIAAAEFVDKISDFRYKKGQVDKAKELLKKEQNVQLETPAIPARPDEPSKKIATPDEKIRKYLEKFGS